MNGISKIAIITKANKLNASSLARAVGVIPQRIIDITNGRTLTISHDLAIRINRAFPQYSVEMLISDDERLWMEEAACRAESSRTNPEIEELRARNAELEEEIARYKQMIIDKEKIIALMETKRK